MDGWNTIVSFWDGATWQVLDLFQGVYVSKVYFFLKLWCISEKV